MKLFEEFQLMMDSRYVKKEKKEVKKELIEKDNEKVIEKIKNIKENILKI